MIAFATLGVLLRKTAALGSTPTEFWGPSEPARTPTNSSIDSHEPEALGDPATAPYGAGLFSSSPTADSAPTLEEQAIANARMQDPWAGAPSEYNPFVRDSSGQLALGTNGQPYRSRMSAEQERAHGRSQQDALRQRTMNVGTGYGSAPNFSASGLGLSGMTSPDAADAINRFSEKQELEGQGAVGMTDKQFSDKMFRDDPQGFREMQARNANSFSAQGKRVPTVDLSASGSAGGRALFRPENADQERRLTELQNRQTAREKNPDAQLPGWERYSGTGNKNSITAQLTPAQKANWDRAGGWGASGPPSATDPGAIAGRKQQAEFEQVYQNNRSNPAEFNRMQQEATQGWANNKAQANSYNDMSKRKPDGTAFTQQERSDAQLASLQNMWRDQRNATAANKMRKAPPVASGALGGHNTAQANLANVGTTPGPAQPVSFGSQPAAKPATTAVPQLNTNPLGNVGAAKPNGLAKTQV